MFLFDLNGDHYAYYYLNKKVLFQEMHDIQLYEFLKIHLILLSFIFILNDNC